MSAAFIIPFAAGLSSVIPGSVPVRDAFGIIGTQSMMAPIIIQSIGYIYVRKANKLKSIDDSRLMGEEAVIPIFEDEAEDTDNSDNAEGALDAANTAFIDNNPEITEIPVARQAASHKPELVIGENNGRK